MMEVMRLASICVLFCLLTGLLAGCAPPPAPPDPLLWGSLKPGPYAVGFGLRWETDSSRVYGLEKDGVTKKARPIPVGVWYPARPSPSEHMQVADYFDMRSKQIQFDELAVRLNAHIRDGLAQNMFGKSAWSGLSADERTAADRFFAMRTSATFDGPPAKGQFPVVIYHPDEPGGYEEDFVLFEYLASHGYVVLSTSYHCEEPANVGDCGGKAGMRDMYFLHRFATLLGNADATQVAAMGYGRGGLGALTWSFERDSPLSGVVSLDAAESDLTEDANQSVPSLLFGRRLSRVFEGVQSGLHYQGLAQKLQHGDFVTNGILRQDARPQREDYDHICQLTLRFMDASLKKDQVALAGLKETSQRHGFGERLLFFDQTSYMDAATSMK
jgi:hypothetical protein